MPSEKTIEVMTGMMLPHALTLWELESSYTEQGPRPGVAEGDSALHIVTLGQSQEVDEISLYCTQPGLAGDARFAFREGTEDYLGWDAPASVQDWEILAFGSGLGLVLREVQDPHGVTLPNGDIAVVYARIFKSVSNWFYSVVVDTWSPLTGSWSGAIVVATLEDLGTGPSAITHRVHPTIAYDAAAGALLVAGWVSVDTDGDGNADAYQVATWLKATGGSWQQVSRAALDSAIPHSSVDVLRRLRWASDGQLCLIASWKAALSVGAAEKYADQVAQYVSQDLGARLLQVWSSDTDTDLGTGHHVDLVALPDGGFVVGMVVRDYEGLEGIRLYKLGAAGQRLLTGAVDMVAGGTPWPIPASHRTGWDTTTGSPAIHSLSDIGGLALAVTEDGELYLYSQRVSGASSCGPMTVASSHDAGLTWGMVGLGSEFAEVAAAVGDWQDTATFFSSYAAVASAGRVCLLTQWTTDVSASQLSLAAVWLGGWTTVEHPNPYSSADPEKLGTWERTGLPLELPSNLGVYSWVAAGGATQALGSDGLTVVGDGKYERNMSGAALLLALREVEVISTAGGTVGIELLVNAALKPRREVHVIVSTTGYVVRDAIAAADLATVTVAGPVVLLASLSQDGSVRVEHRAPGGPHQKWVTGFLGSTSTSGLGTGNSMITWGNLSSTFASQPESVWRQWHDAGALLSGVDGGIADQASPDDLVGHPYPLRAAPLSAGVSIRSLDGPALPGDAHTIKVFADARASRAAGSILPRDTWRSLNSSSAESLAYAFSADSMGADQDIGADLLALWLRTNGLKDLTLQRYTGGAWVSMGTLDMAVQAGLGSLPFTRQGDALIPAGIVSGTDHYYGDLVGWTALLPGGIARRVVRSTEGAWRNAGGRSLVLTLEGVDPADPISGDVDLVPPEAVVLIDLAGASAGGIKIDLPAQPTVEGYHELSLALGPVKITPCSNWGWGTTWEAQVDSGRSEGRRPLIRQRAPLERVWEWGWDGGKITTWFEEPDYILGSSRPGAKPVATIDVAQQLQGMWREVGGGQAPVVCLRSIPRVSSEITVLTRRRQWMYGLTTNAALVTDNVVVGRGGQTATDGDREILRIPRIGVRELH